VKAKQRIKAFLLDVTGSVEKAAIAVIQKWVENQFGDVNRYTEGSR
jgi:hypothetical protein